ncbi:Lem3/Cdc50 [Xylariaceae sp. FL1272]|nr:Lem3/Cdc50 [Xylariaceae sp. FL1272]
MAQSDDGKAKSRRPPNTAFRQQRLKAWQPLATPKTIIPLYIAIGVVTAIIGALLLYSSRLVKVIEIDYTNCHTDAPETSSKIAPMKSSDVYSFFQENSSEINAQWYRTTNITHDYNGFKVGNLTNCTLQFETPVDMKGVHMYYFLNGWYQNHRSYVKSFFADQLAGKDVSHTQVTNSDCSPLDVNGTQSIYPCGLIANSLFNDSIGWPEQIGVSGSLEERTFNMTDSNIAWDGDLELYKDTPFRDSGNYSSIVPPPNWTPRYPDGLYSKEFPPPNLKEDQHFIVWMRTAALPAFYKLYATPATSDAMPAGTWRVNITDNFHTDEYNVRKKLVLTTVSQYTGGKNDFLGIAFLAVAGFCIVLALIKLVLNWVKPRRLGDHTYLTWNKEQVRKGKDREGQAIGMATGRDL